MHHRAAQRYCPHAQQKGGPKAAPRQSSECDQKALSGGEGDRRALDCVLNALEFAQRVVGEKQERVSFALVHEAISPLERHAERRTRVTDEQAITSRGCEGRNPCTRRGLDGRWFGPSGPRSDGRRGEPQNAKCSDCCFLSRGVRRLGQRCEGQDAQRPDAPYLVPTQRPQRYLRSQPPVRPVPS